MELYNTQKILSETGLFWQYPVKTEEEFFNQNFHNPNYMGVPWATVIDKNVHLNSLLKYLIPYSKHKNYYTCCQHIHFRKIMPLLQILGVKTVYTPHKCKNEDEILGIQLLPCPLFAVNIEDAERNTVFQNKDFLNIPRSKLFSFVGGYQQNYMSNIRKNIFNISKSDNILIQNTGQWHFNNVVYSHKQNSDKELNISTQHKLNTENYNKILLDSRFSLCPSGSGPNSIRFWESLACGSIPILLSDTLELPKNINWNDSIVFLKENELGNIYNILGDISEEDERKMRENCIKIYNTLKDNYKNCKYDIVHYCCGAYHIGDFGGVARYDYNLFLSFPHRIFIKGPQQKNLLLNILKQLKNPLVITDNHLSCDIPNNYKTILVHHGSALTHAEREPGWNKYWKDLCCNGQRKMLNIRSHNNTHIVSASTFCYDEFLKYFPETYPKFKNTTILHTSELKFKYNSSLTREFNEIPIIFGNFSGYLKGEHIYNNLTKYFNKHNLKYKFEKLYCKFDRKTDKTISDYNTRKANIYKSKDIFMQLSICEGYSYATLDAFAAGNVILATDVGLTYKDVPDDCFVKLDYKKLDDINYLKNKIEFAWKNRENLSKKAFEFYNSYLSYNDWNKKMYKLIHNM